MLKKIVKVVLKLLIKLEIMVNIVEIIGLLKKDVVGVFEVLIGEIVIVIGKCGGFGMFMIFGLCKIVVCVKLV